MYLEMHFVLPWCSGYHYCTYSLTKVWTQVLRRLKACSWLIGDLRRWEPLKMIPTRSKDKRLSSVNHSAKEVFLRKGVLKICRKITGEYPCRSVNLIMWQNNFSEITFRYGCSPVYLKHIFRAPFPRTPLEDCFCIPQKQFITIFKYLRWSL